MANKNRPLNKKLRFLTATSLFDGHDATINIIRRMLQSKGVEVIHLGHNRSVDEIVSAAIQEDVDAIAVSSYQGGHMEFYTYLIEELKSSGYSGIKVFGGGGGVIVADEIISLEASGVSRIYSPEAGQSLGLNGMIEDMISIASKEERGLLTTTDLENIKSNDRVTLPRLLTHLENGNADESLVEKLTVDRRGNDSKQYADPIVLGITGTGGSGKSSLTDELVLRFRLDYQEKLKIAILAIDPSRRKTGGALLGDRIRMNAIHTPQIFMRSLATRQAEGEVPLSLELMVAATRLAGYDLIIIETPGIGQGSMGIVPFVDLSLYVMTPEFGAATQLEKIDMLDYADLVAINKFDRQGAEDALRDVRKQVQRNQESFSEAPEALPVFGTMASHFNDSGVSSLYQRLNQLLVERGWQGDRGISNPPQTTASLPPSPIVPIQQVHYLAEIAESVRHYRREAEQQSEIAREHQQLTSSAQMVERAGGESKAIKTLAGERHNTLNPESIELLAGWDRMKQYYQKSEFYYQSLSQSLIPKVALPKYSDQGDRLRWLMLENVPGSFPYTAGVFQFKRESEDPTRMFAGEGDPFRTNERFKYLSRHSTAKRLSTAFDSVTLYGTDPDLRPDIYGKVGNSGVSVATLDDMKVLYAGFDLCDPKTSVSMTINGPAPTLLAMYLNTAIDQQKEKFIDQHGRDPEDGEEAEIVSQTLENVRGTVQADILKEDQGQNTCLFSTEFSLKMMGDIQEYFIERNIRNFYSVSISGYHIAEAGANPITQLAFTLANGFTYVESYLARGMNIDDFAHNLSFFFSHGMDPEYTVLGRVARRIWAVSLRERYGANSRSQKLKYHIQTSGRSLHAQEMNFNEIRTTLQALIAVYDNCNSLHTNAHDEAITTPSEESVRRALAIQLIINSEWGLAKNENPNQGSFVVEELTNLVEEAVLAEFEKLSERGGVLGAMETGYQRGRIQDESLEYEHKKHDGSYPVIGVNTFENPNPEEHQSVELARSTGGEKESQLNRLQDFKKRHQTTGVEASRRLQQTALEGGNVFAALMEVVKHCSLGEITQTLFQVGGQYRRNM